MKSIIYISVISVLLMNSLSAQINSGLEVSSTFDDNVFRSPVPVEDLITDFDFDLGYRFLNSNFHVYYNGNLIVFQNQKERNLSLHRLGLSYFVPFGKDEQHTFFIGANGLTRLDGEEYKEYDYNQFYAYANLRFDFDFLFLKTGYNFRYRDYSNFSELNNLRHYIFLQMNKSFESRTTFILEADLGYKAFTSPIYFTTLQNSTFGGGGNGQGPGGETSFESSVPITVASDIPPMGHIVFLARIAQSIFEKMGVYVQYREQINLSNKITSITGSSFYQDEELFDDPFSFESKSLSGQLTWMMPWSMRLQIGGSLDDKSYIEEAYISIDDSIGAGGNRLDNQKNFYLNLTKTFDIEEKWLNALLLNLYIGYTRNNSNSYWYNYNNRVIGGGIQWHF